MKATPTLLLTTLLIASSLSAADVTWDIGSAADIQGGAGTWDLSSTHWTTDGGASNITWNNGLNAADIAVFQGTAGTVTLNGGGADIFAGGITISTAGYTIASASVNDRLNFGGNTGVISSSVLANANIATISANLAGTNGATIAANGDGTTYNGSSSAGRLDILGNNTGLTGGITVTSGLVRFANQNSAGTDTLTLNGGGLLAVNAGAGGGNLTLNNAVVISDSGGTLRSWGGTTLTLSGAVTGGGLLSKTDTGTAVLTNYAGTGSIAVGAGVLELAQANVTLTQAITGVGTNRGTLLLSGGGTHTLSSTTNAANFQVTNGGTLNLTASNGTGTTVTLDATSSAFRTNGGNTSGYNGTTYNITGNGVAATTGVTLLSGANFVGGFNVTGAATRIRVSGATATTFYGFDTNGTHITVNAAASGTVFDPLVNFNAGGYGMVIKADAGANNADGDLIFNGALTGAVNGNQNRFWINKGGTTGSVLLNGTGTTTSFTQIDGGKLLVGNNEALGGGTLSVGGPATVASHGGAKTLANKIFIQDNKTVTFDTSKGDMTLSGAISGVANNAAAAGTGNNIVKTGANKLVLTGNNIFTGSTLINGGTLVTGSNSALGAGAATVTVASGATLQIGDGTVNSVTLGAGASLVVHGTLSFHSADSAIALSGPGFYQFDNSAVLHLNDAFNAVGTYDLIIGGTGLNLDGVFTITGADSTNFNHSFSNGKLTVSAIPEPQTYGLLGISALAVMVAVRRRKRS